MCSDVSFLIIIIGILWSFKNEISNGANQVVIKGHNMKTNMNAKQN